MRIALLLLFIIQITFQVAISQGQEIIPANEKKNSIYLTWGYHRNAYTTSTIHLKDHSSDNYDFTLYHAKAKDKPDMHQLWKSPLTVPQYVFRLGYFFNTKNPNISNIDMPTDANDVKFDIRKAFIQYLKNKK